MSNASVANSIDSVDSSIMLSPGVGITSLIYGETLMCWNSDPDAESLGNMGVSSLARANFSGYDVDRLWVGFCFEGGPATSQSGLSNLDLS